MTLSHFFHPEPNKIRRGEILKVLNTCEETIDSALLLVDSYRTGDAVVLLKHAVTELNNLSLTWKRSYFFHSIVEITGGINRIESVTTHNTVRLELASIRLQLKTLRRSLDKDFLQNLPITSDRFRAYRMPALLAIGFLIAVGFALAYRRAQYPALSTSDSLRVEITLPEGDIVSFDQPIVLSKNWREYRVVFGEARDLEKVMIRPLTQRGAKIQIESVRFAGDANPHRISFRLSANLLPTDFKQIGNVVLMRPGTLVAGGVSEMITTGPDPHFYLHPGSLKSITEISIRMRVVEAYNSFPDPGTAP